MRRNAYYLFVALCAAIIAGCTTNGSTSGVTSSELHGLLIARYKVGETTEVQMLLMDTEGNERKLGVLPQVPQYAKGKLYYFSTPVDLVSNDILFQKQTTIHFDTAISEPKLSHFIVHPDGKTVFLLQGPCASDLEQGETFSCDLYMNSLESVTNILLESIEQPGIWGLVDFAGISEDGEWIFYDVRTDGKSKIYAYSLSKRKSQLMAENPSLTLPDKFGYSKCEGKALAYTNEIAAYSYYGYVMRGENVDNLITCLP